nr:phosphoadenosine phosphosulfate reductase family protein [Candidatus Profftella armatura (Diaphorina cf. continua)]
MTFFGRKKSVVLLRLAEKVFRSSYFLFPIVHIDTGYNFSEVISFRDNCI